MNWINIRDKEPTIKDLPFATYLNKVWDLWEDSDWFQELTEQERLEHEYWMPLYPPDLKVKLRINNTDYTFADGGENALKKRLLAKYPPETIVSEWVDGELVNTTTLDGIFN